MILGGYTPKKYLKDVIIVLMMISVIRSRD